MNEITGGCQREYPLRSANSLCGIVIMDFCSYYVKYLA
jgi:hypothetical protein